MFQVGDRVRLSVEGEEIYQDQAKGSTGTVTTRTNGNGWTDVRWDNGHSNNYEVKDLFVTVRVDTPAIASPDTVAPSAEQEEVAARIKYLYSVQDASGSPLVNTRDREYAREVKSFMGGKKEGIIIMAYAPVKEIR